MKICDVVLNSVWYDPRVRKQLIEYREHDVDVVAVGLKCERYDEDKIKAMPVKTIITRIPDGYSGHQKSVFRKIKRKKLQEKAIIDSIVSEKPDIIHANDLNALLPAYKAKKKLNCKLVFDAHEVFWSNFLDGKHRLYSMYLYLCEAFLSRKVDLFVCVSHAAAEFYSSKYHIKKPMVITNCSLKSEQTLSTDKNSGFEVLNHGQFYSGRGYDIMMEAIPYLKDYPEIKVAARGFGSLEESMRAIAARHGNESARFYPKVSVEELIPLASKSHVGIAITEPICLNFKLSVSNKLFEYASAGLPVIMSDIPEHRYLNDKYHLGVVISENTPKALAEAIIRLYTDKKFYDSCVEGAIRMTEEVNWENEFNRLLEAESSMVATQ